MLSYLPIVLLSLSLRRRKPGRKLRKRRERLSKLWKSDKEITKIDHAKINLLDNVKMKKKLVVEPTSKWKNKLDRESYNRIWWSNRDKSTRQTVWKMNQLKIIKWLECKNNMKKWKTLAFRTWLEIRKWMLKEGKRWNDRKSGFSSVIDW